jgi:hypothetical protein
MPVFGLDDVINFPSSRHVKMRHLMHAAGIICSTKSTIRRPFAHYYFVDNLADKDRILGLGHFSKR